MRKSKRLKKSHDSWESLKKALLEKYDYQESKGRGHGEFDQWVTSSKTNQSARHTFLECERRFAQLSLWDQRLVGVDKVLMFVKSID